MLVTITRNSTILSKYINSELLVGIFWKVLSCACFAGINIIVRYLARDSLSIEQKLSSLTIMFFQNIIATIFLLPFIFQKTNSINIFKNFILSKYLILQIIRITTAIGGIYLWYFSLAKMPVPQVVAISFLSPVITVIGAAILLKEKLNINRSLAIFLSLTGGFLISRPDLAIFNNFSNWDAIFPICAALIFSADKLITRKILILKECPALTTIYLMLFTAPLCLIIALLTDSWNFPTTSNFLPLLLSGILYAMAHFAFNKSLETSEITLVMPYGITKIIFNSILSYLVFSEIPETFTMWLGIIIISASTILLI